MACYALRFCCPIALAAGLFSACSTRPPAAVCPVYLQVFYEGPNWMSGRRVLAYSPAFKGKTGELVQDTDSARALSPGALPSGPAAESGATTTTTVTTTAAGEILTTGPDEKSRRQAAAQVRQEAAAMFNAGLRQLEKRADLAQAALTQALNETAADGWEVVQMTAYGSRGGLVYLRRR